VARLRGVSKYGYLCSDFGAYLKEASATGETLSAARSNISFSHIPMGPLQGSRMPALLGRSGSLQAASGFNKVSIPCAAMRGPSTNPELIAVRIKRLKQHLLVTYKELAELFGVKTLTVQRWGLGMFAPRLEFQRTLERLERQHGLR